MAYLQCPGCDKKLKVPDDAGGKRVRCTGCERIVTIPPPAPPVAKNAAASRWSSMLHSPQTPEEIGRLGPYRILRVLGQGGMGVVFQAEDTKLGRVVALKAMLPTTAAADPVANKRFLREARAMAALEHRHIVRLYQVDEDNGIPFLAMEFLKGESLESRLEREPILPIAEATRIGREVAEGLAVAHERGLIHRDIKPANVWLEEPDASVKILDFGLARVTGDSQITATGIVLGTPGFMSPEQCGDQPIDHRSDLFSVGVLLFRMTTGQVPFDGKNVVQVLIAMTDQEPPSPQLLNFEISDDLSNLMLKLIAPEPNDRVQTAGEIAKLLAGIERGEVVAAPSPPSPKRDEKRSASKKWILIAAIASLALVAAILVSVFAFR